MKLSQRREAKQAGRQQLIAYQVVMLRHVTMPTQAPPFTQACPRSSLCSLAEKHDDSCDSDLPVRHGFRFCAL